MLNLTDKQIEFLEKEIGTKKADLENVDKEEWRAIREKCFDISVDELLDEVGNAVETVSSRCVMAESIADIKYSQLYV